MTTVCAAMGQHLWDTRAYGFSPPEPQGRDTERYRECYKTPAEKLLCGLEEMTATRVEETGKKKTMGWNLS